MNKELLINTFNELAKFEFSVGNNWKGIAFHKAMNHISTAKSFKRLDKRVVLEFDDDSFVTLGSSCSEIFIDVIDNGYSKRLSSIELSKTRILDDLTNISGIGDKKKQKLIESGIKTISDIINLNLSAGDYFPNTNIKFTEGMSTGLKLFLRTKNKRITREKATEYCQDFKNYLIKNNIKNFEMYVLGSYRRRKPTVGDIDIIIVPCKDLKIIGDVKSVVRNWFDDIFVDGDSKKSGVKGETQVDVRFIERKYLGAHMLHGTGSAEYNISVRAEAIRRGYHLNEWGVLDGTKLLTFESEREVLNFLGLPYVPPYLR